MKMRRTSEDIEKQLRHLRRIIDKASALPLMDYGSRLQMESLLAEEKQLVDKLKAAHLLSDNTAVQIALTGNPVVSHAVDIHFLGAFLLHLQKFIDALGQSITGDATHFGLVPGKVRDSNQLFATSLMPTSFGLNFSLAEDLSDQPVLSSDDSEEIFDALPVAISSLAGYFNGEAPLSQLSEIVGTPRVRAQYESLVKLLSIHGTTLELRTRQDPLPVYLTPQQSQQRREWIKSIQHEVRSLDVVGRLTGFNIRLRNFEIEAENNILYHGTVTESSLSMLKRIPAGSRIRANILETTERHGDLNVDYRQTYRLRLIDLDKTEN